MAVNDTYKTVVWERQNKMGKWCPYSPENSQFLEMNNKMNTHTVNLGDVDSSLKMYSVDLKDMMQISEATGKKSAVRRQLYDDAVLERGFMWQWQGDGHDIWHSYDIDVNNFIETAFLQGKNSINLSKAFHGYSYVIDFTKMIQINKHTKRKRTIRRHQNVSLYPVENCLSYNATDKETGKTEDIYSHIKEEVPGTTALLHQVNKYLNNVVKNGLSYETSEDCMIASENSHRRVIEHSKESESENINKKTCLDPSLYTLGASVALVNGKPWTASKPPHTPESKLKPVPCINPLPKLERRKHHKNDKESLENDAVKSTTILEEFTEKCIVLPSDNSDEQMCIICCERFSKGSSYNGDKTVVKLLLCSHMFHLACLEAMYNSGSKDKFLQCPTCKKIHGQKYGIQPPGSMIYHVLPYSLPGYPEYDTIRIIYNIPSGIQGPEHPNQGKKYTARGFPRHCYLPDSEKGRKVLRLLIKAWKRRLIFTIGSSSTTGEDNTVTWNEIHHKTEFGCNKHGHGYPDPNYLDNVLAELKEHGVTDDEVSLWHTV